MPAPEQAEKAWSSKRHWNVDWDSLEENLKVGVASLVAEPFPGPEDIVTAGGVVSNWKWRETLSVACVTVNVWPPFKSPGLVNGELQSALTIAPSIRQVKPLESGDEKVNVGVGSLVGAPELGPEVMARPTVQVLVAGEPVFPTASVALTSKVCCPSASWLAV